MAYYHGWATVPRRERAATCPYKKTSHALGDGSFRLGTHDARTSYIPLNGSSCNASEGDRSDSHWRQP